MKRKILVIMSIVIMTMAFLGNNLISTAVTIEPIEQMKSFTENAEDKSDIGEKVRNFGGSVIVTVQVVVTGIAVIMLIVLAMKYMLAAPGDKADIKKHAVVYVVGAVILFSVSGILKIIQVFSEQNINTQS